MKTMKKQNSFDTLLTEDNRIQDIYPLSLYKMYIIHWNNWSEAEHAGPGESSEDKSRGVDHPQQLAQKTWSATATISVAREIKFYLHFMNGLLLALYLSTDRCQLVIQDARGLWRKAGSSTAMRSPHSLGPSEDCKVLQSACTQVSVRMDGWCYRYNLTTNAQMA